ncbi:MAG: NAD-dependent epimerase/dehydratase family protein [Candidatus Lokiarchaeota archaeon]|nr:NAD-dependent epimerase/dehydratase family protein [Candidatus Lokiarchaeota archaeon]MBD3198765.1 NAD-dependent epimerase/dehydratase family protein [Candidatus Lokiarchaeota archaeon]
MKKILVTGGTGFIGIPLVKKLYELGYDLRLLVRKTSDISPFKDLEGIEYFIGDITDFESIQKAAEDIEVIYHLAAYTGIWAKDDKVYENINVKGTENIAQTAFENNLRLIYISSFTALGPTPEEPVSEHYEKTDEFYLNYERTKYEGKKVVQKYFEKGLNGVIFYPGIVYGPGDFNIFGEMLYDIVRGKFMGCPGDGDSMACFSYVFDLVDTLVKVLEMENIQREDFILGGENIKFDKYLCMIADIAEKKEPRHFPMSAAKFYAWLCELKSKITGKIPYITRATLDSFELNRSYSSEKAKEILDYTITPLEKGLEKTVKWYKDYIDKNGKVDDEPRIVSDVLTEINVVNS